MSTVSISQLKDHLSEYLNRVAHGRERIIVASRGKPKAALISLADLERLEELEEAQAAREALAEYEREETIPLSLVVATWVGPCAVKNSMIAMAAESSYVVYTKPYADIRSTGRFRR